MWFELSLFFALATSISLQISKHVIKDIKPIHFAVIVNLLTLPFTFILLLMMKIPIVSFEFYKLLIFSAILDSIAAYSSYKALTLSPVSLLAPISSFNPVFTLFFASIFLNEQPTLLKFIGILIIVLGSYLLNISNIKEGLLKPFTKLFSDKGVQLFLLANFCWGITPIFQKQAILLTNPQTPLYAAFVGSIFVTLMLFPFALKQKFDVNSIKKSTKWLLILGILSTLAALAAFTAFSQTNVAYSTAIFKLSTLFSVILGAVLFKEKRVKERFLGASVMVLGTILLAF